MASTDLKTKLFNHFVGLTLFLVSFYACFSWGQKSYDMRHTSFMVDAAYRLTIGQWPSLDFVTGVTPLSFLILAVGFLVLGVSYKTFLVVSGLVSGFFSFFVYQFFVKHISVKQAFFVGLLSIIYVCGSFAVLWYTSVSVVLSYGVIFLLAAYFFEKKNGWFLFFAGLMAGLSFMSKQNVGAFAFLLGLVALVFIKERFRLLLAYSFGFFSVVGLFLLVLNFFSQAAPFQEYVITMVQSGAVLRKDFGLSFYLPFYGSIIYFLPHGVLVWLLFSWLGDRFAQQKPLKLLLAFSCLLQLANGYTSTLDVTSNLSYTPLIFGFFLLFLKTQKVNKFQMSCVILIGLYLGMFQYKACLDRRSLYGKERTVTYEASFVPGIPFLKESDYTQGLGQAYAFCRQIPQEESVWFDPDCGILAALLDRPRPHQPVGLFIGYTYKTQEDFGQVLWQQMIQKGHPQWLVIQGGDRFGVMSSEGGRDFSVNVKKFYEPHVQFGLFHIMKLKPNE